jgi:hypothetical protein
MNDSPGEILLALGRLEGKVDALISQQARHQKQLDILDSRICRLEGSKALLVGMCTALATAASYVVTLYK